MATEMITLKLDSKFLKEIDAVVKEENYQNRTEFIREALRDGLDNKKMKKVMRQLASLKGSLKKGTTDADMHRIREDVFAQLERKHSGL